MVFKELQKFRIDLFWFWEFRRRQKNFSQIFLDSFNFSDIREIHQWFLWILEFQRSRKIRINFSWLCHKTSKLIFTDFVNYRDVRKIQARFFSDSVDFRETNKSVNCFSWFCKIQRCQKNSWLIFLDSGNHGESRKIDVNRIVQGKEFRAEYSKLRRIMKI